MSYPVQQNVAVGLLQFHLKGFDGYPNSPAGESTFARALCESTVSVAHCEAVLKTFDLKFPTVREIKDIANNLREKFQPTESRYEKWEREYGTAEPFDMSTEKGCCACCGRPWADILANAPKVINGELKGGCCSRVIG